MHAYFFFSIHDRLFANVAVQVRRLVRDFTFGGAVWDAGQAEWIEEVTGACVDVLADTLFGGQVAPLGAAEADRLLARCGVTAGQLLQSDRHAAPSMSADERTRLLLSALGWARERLDAEEPDVVISEDISDLPSFALWCAATDRGIPFAAIGSGRVPGRIAIYGNPWGYWERLDTVSEEPVSAASAAAAADYLRAFRAEPSAPVGIAELSRMGTSARADVRALATLAAWAITGRTSLVRVSPLVAVRNRVRRLVRSRLQQRFFTRGSVEAPYVLFPLHLEPEAATLVRGAMYVDQIDVARSLALCLPVGWRLVVKEHAVARGRRSDSYYRELLDIPEVHLVSADADGWALIQGAAGVATITGTMGFEGVLFGKPVFAVGHAFYHDAPGVTNLNQLPKDEWPTALQRGLKTATPLPAVSRFLARVLEATSPGVIAHADAVPAVLREENSRHIAEAILNHLSNGDSREPGGVGGEP